MERQVPYSFAKNKKEVFLENDNGKSRILCKEGVSTDVMQEACRYKDLSPLSFFIDLGEGRNDEDLLETTR